MSSSISRVTLLSLESPCKNAIRRNQILHVLTLTFVMLEDALKIMDLMGTGCVRGLGCYFTMSEIQARCEKVLSKQICLKSALGEKKTSLLLRGANCSTSSILFIAVWMFLLTAHLCAEWVVKILSSCFEWTGSHIQGHYALKVREIKHQITVRLI